MSTFFLYRSRHHRDLHSFPTRRSSDLPPEFRGDSPIAIPTPMGQRDVLDLGPHRHRLRSEEHTSELQSRRDLVCRLLLEKKNKWRRMCWPWRAPRIALIMIATPPAASA